jgi:hypothetical protein
MAQVTYEVRVAGVVPAQDLEDIGASNASTEEASTLLYGEILDETALYELLGRLRSLGLEVLEVRRIPALGGLSKAAFPEPPPHGDRYE